MKKLIAFIILVILVILVICLSYNYYKKQESQRGKVNKLKTDLETSEILDSKNDNDSIEVEEKDTNKEKSDNKDSDNKDNKSDSKSSSSSNSSNSNNSKSNKSNNSSDDDSSYDGETEEETNMNVPDTASGDNSGFVKLNYYTIEVRDSSIKTGKTTKIIVKYYPENASIKDTIFVSETKDVCKVSSLGKVTGLKKGTCSVLVKVKNQSTKSILLNVK